MGGDKSYVLRSRGYRDLAFEDLRRRNRDRQSRWMNRTTWSLSDWGVAAGGEMGEALNVIKKLNRVRDGLVGNTATEAKLRAQLAGEIADTVIYLDLLAQAAGIDLAKAVAETFNAKSEQLGFPERLGEP